jgi:hypothetical protein
MRHQLARQAGQRFAVERLRRHPQPVRRAVRHRFRREHRHPGLEAGEAVAHLAGQPAPRGSEGGLGEGGGAARHARVPCRRGDVERASEQAARRAWRPDRHRLLHPAPPRAAGGAHWACLAARCTRQAGAGAEVHQRLDDVTRRVVPQQPRHLRRQRGPGRRQLLRHQEQPHRHALEVRVHRRVRLAEGQRADRRRGVGADAGQRAQRLRLARHAPGVLRHDPARRRVQVARARVAAKPAPVAEHLLLDRHGGDRGGVREARDESLEMPRHDADAHLLQHHLADPDAVRVRQGAGRGAPGQQAAVARVPAEQRGGDPGVRGGCGGHKARVARPAPGRHRASASEAIGPRGFPPAGGNASGVSGMTSQSCEKKPARG